MRETTNIVSCCSQQDKINFGLLGNSIFFGQLKIDFCQQKLAALGMYELAQLSGGCKKH
jgi:hypothetical protein